MANVRASCRRIARPSCAAILVQAPDGQAKPLQGNAEEKHEVKLPPNAKSVTIGGKAGFFSELAPFYNGNSRFLNGQVTIDLRKEGNTVKIDRVLRSKTGDIVKGKLAGVFRLDGYVQAMTVKIWVEGIGDEDVNLKPSNKPSVTL